jgi:hypothetical protein
VLETYVVESLDAPDRQFQVWDYTPTHCQLLLQSDRVPERGLANRIEVLFPGVAYMSLPPVMPSMQLRRADTETRSRVLDLHHLHDDSELDVYLLNADGSWFVVSGPPSWAEADRAYDEPSVFFPRSTHIDPDLKIWRLV